MKVKTEIEKLKTIDIYSLMLFALFKLTDDPRYSTLSELAYVLDKENLLKLCEYFGGLTIHIPTIDELQNVLYALVVYQYVDLEGKTFDSAVKIVAHESDDISGVRKAYKKIKEILNGYDFTPRINEG